MATFEPRDLKQIQDSGSFVMFMTTVSKWNVSKTTKRPVDFVDVQSTLHDIDHVRSSFVHEMYMSDSAGRKKAEADLKKEDDSYILEG